MTISQRTKCSRWGQPNPVQSLCGQRHLVKMLACAMQRIIPEGVEAPTAFETVGHIAHLNLKPEQLAYKHAIGQVRTQCPACPAAATAEPAATSAMSPHQLLQVLIDKNPSIRTVVNKVMLPQNR